jgi:hypothetical protein
MRREIEDDGYSFKTVSHELGEVVVKVTINLVEIVLEIK